MEHFYKAEAKSLVRAIEDRASPFRARQALAYRDKLLDQNARGIVEFSQEVRTMLERAQIPRFSAGSSPPELVA